MNTADGFTLVELMIVLTVVIALVAMSLGPASRLIRWQKEMQTQQILDSLSSAIGSIYTTNAWEIDTSAATEFKFRFNGKEYTLTPGSGSDAANFDALQAIAAMANIASSAIDKDAMHQELHIFVSSQLNDSNANVSYHTIAIVSPGWDSVLESTFATDTGILTLSGDDKGVLISGWQYEVNNVQATMAKMGVVRDSYQNYFTSLYMLDTEKNIYVDRFANTDATCASSPNWDSTSGVGNSGCKGLPSTYATDIGLKSALGLSEDAVTTAWGREMLIDNAAANVARNPDVNGLSVPYTATINAEEPWGTGNLLTVTATGLY
jgi:type II secretory pathway pseudopilin PulG